VDFQDGDGYFYGSPVASSDVVGAYLVDVARILEQKGDKQATICWIGTRRIRPK